MLRTAMLILLPSLRTPFERSPHRASPARARSMTPARASTSAAGERPAARQPSLGGGGGAAAAQESAPAGAAASSCRVVARFRPLTAREAEADGRCVEYDAAAGQVVVSPAPGAEPLPFAYDAVLPEGTTQEEVFACVARETADRVQQGFNGARARVHVVGSWALARARALGRRACHRGCARRGALTPRAPRARQAPSSRTGSPAAARRSQWARVAWRAPTRSKASSRASFAIYWPHTARRVS
jgi:hypothetical protein